MSMLAETGVIMSENKNRLIYCRMIFFKKLLLYRQGSLYNYTKVVEYSVYN